jgi:hypothetical protein
MPGIPFRAARPARQLVRRTLLVLAGCSSVAGAQAWDAPAAMNLVRRAIERRNVQIADSALAGYQARATGRLLFLAQLGDTAVMAPRVVKADQLAVDVYWKAPASSKQVIVGMRDTLLLPGDIGYYQDRYGIVQSNFPNLIRLGEGRDVRDVPHPLAPNAPTLYEYALRDSLTITLPDRRLAVYELAVRPRDPRAARVVGSLFLDRGSADIVRMSLTFTDAAILDRRIERLSVVLENALIEGRFWLPRRQELEVARIGSWLDLPVRGIIRGSWQICCYDINLAPDSTVFTGPPIARAPLSRRQAFTWDEPLAEVLPADVSAVTEEDVARVQALAQTLVSRAVLARANATAVSARSLGDFLRYNRVEGLALGAGTSRQWGGRWSAALRGRYGFEDHAWKGRADLTARLRGLAVTLFAADDFRDAGDVSEGSSLRNSLAAQEFGSDYTDPYRVSAAGGTLSGSVMGVRWSLGAAHERHAPLVVQATPAHGRFQETLPAARLEGTLAEAVLSDAHAAGRGELRWELRLRGADLHPRSDSAATATRFVRGSAGVRYRRESARASLRLTSTFAAAAGVNGTAVPPQGLVYLGGPVSGPGYGYHAFRWRRGASLRVEAGRTVPFPSIPLARYGTSPPSARLLPFLHAVAGSGGGRGGVYPAVGVALETFFDLLRIEGARGLRDGRWTFSLDLSEGFRAVF